MIASDTLFDPMGGFPGVKLSDEDIAEMECQRVVASVKLLTVFQRHCSRKT